MQLEECNQFKENIPAYALGALDVDDSAALEIHLRNCRGCQSELEQYRAVGEGLLLAVAPQPPSAALRRRLQARLPAARQGFGFSFLRVMSFGQFALALTVILLIALNYISFIQIQALQKRQVQLEAQIKNGQAALSLLSSSDTRLLPIRADGISGTILVDKPNNIATLVIWNLPVLNSNQTYQIWWIDGQGKRSSAGLFQAAVGQAFTTETIVSSQALATFKGLGVTVEPAAGSPQPTGVRIFKVDF